jgi:ATP-dependent RNA helicase DeaD
LDEADEMLNMGFLDDINEILEGIPKDRNTLLFSATMPKEIQRIANKYMTDPLEVVAGTRGAGAENVKHLLYTVHAKDKYHALKRLADFYPEIYGIVFCRTRRETQEIADKLIQDGYNADSLHGDLSQAQRDYVMQKFRIRNIRLLVATDVAARGLDVNDLTHVIHYSLPDEKEVYTHRSGRTGRIGKAGISIAITHLREKYAVTQIEKLLGIAFIKSTMPTGREICEKQLFNLIDKMEHVELDHSQIDTYLPVIYKKLEWLSKEELIKRFVSLEFNRFLDYYRDADNLSEPTEERGGRRDRDRGERGSRRERGEKGDRGDRGERRSRQRDSDGQAESGYTRIFINLGKMDGLVPNGLIEVINKSVEGPKIPVGRIDLMKKFSFFEVKSEHAKKLINKLNRDTYFRGSRVAVELAQGKDAQEKKEFTKRVDGARKKRKRRFD